MKPDTMKPDTDWFPYWALLFGIVGAAAIAATAYYEQTTPAWNRGQHDVPTTPVVVMHPPHYIPPAPAIYRPPPSRPSQFRSPPTLGKRR